MAFFDILRRNRENAEPPKRAGNPNPVTYATTAGPQFRPDWSPDPAHTPEILEQLRGIYERGGIVSQIIDTYSLMITRRGWVIESENEEISTRVQEELLRLQCDRWLGYMVRQSLIFGYGVCEIILTRGGDIHSIAMRNASMFDAYMDAFGLVSHYVQRLNGKNNEIPLESLLWVVAVDSDTPYGVSYLYRALDDIVRDTKVSEGMTVAIERHGTPKHWHKIGSKEAPATQADVDRYSAFVRRVKFDSELITAHDVEVTAMDSGQTVAVGAYNEFTLMRVCSAMGIPAELVGLRLGTTDNTAVSRINAFFDQIQGIQDTIAAQITSQLVDRIVGESGLAFFSFQDASSVDESEKADWIVNLMKAVPQDPLWVGEAWIREQLKIPTPEYEEL